MATRDYGKVIRKKLKENPELAERVHSITIKKNASMIRAESQLRKLLHENSCMMSLACDNGREFWLWYAGSVVGVGETLVDVLKTYRTWVRTGKRPNTKQ